jgi:hypothetical protein
VNLATDSLVGIDEDGGSLHVMARYCTHGLVIPSGGMIVSDSVPDRPPTRTREDGR